MTPRVIVAQGLFTQTALDQAQTTHGIEFAYGSLSEASDIGATTDGAAAILVTIQPVSARTIAALSPSVRIIGRAGIGLDAIDLDAARSRGLAVFHTPDYCIAEVASHALAMILALQRRLQRSDVVARETWTDWRSVGVIGPLTEMTVGVIGFGRIGRAVTELLRAIGIPVIIHDPWLTSAPPDLETVDTIDELARRADLITLHAPLTPETRGLISRPIIASMRPGAMLVNVSRGALIDEAALAAALYDGRLAGVALDVLTVEPPDADSPLLHTPNTLLSPHTAWYSTTSEKRVWHETVDAIAAYLDGRPPSSGRLAVDPTSSGAS